MNCEIQILIVSAVYNGIVKTIQTLDLSALSYTALQCPTVLWIGPVTGVYTFSSVYSEGFSPICRARASVQCCMCFTRFVEIQTYFLHRLQRLCSAQFDALESSGLTAKHCGYSACTTSTRLCEIQTYYSLAQHTEHLQGIWVVTRVLYLCMCICVFLSVFM